MPKSKGATAKTQALCEGSTSKVQASSTTEVDCDADFSKLIAKVAPLKKKGDKAATKEWKALVKRRGDCE